MRWFTGRVQRLREDVDSIKREIGEDPYDPSIDGFSWSLVLCPRRGKSIKERLSQIEEDNRLLCECLGLEKHTSPESTVFRKKPKAKK